MNKGRVDKGAQLPSVTEKGLKRIYKSLIEGRDRGNEREGKTRGDLVLLPGSPLEKRSRWRKKKVKSD